MKKILLIGIAAVLVTTTIFSGCIQNDTGVLVLKITDDPSALNITHMNVTISQVMVHRSAAVNNTTAGWEMIVDEPQMFDLIALTNATEFFGSTNLSVGMYTQIRLIIEKCNITINGTIYDCTIPSDAIKLIKTFEIKANQNTTLTMDFDAKESIIETGNHQYKFNPVIKIIQE